MFDAAFSGDLWSSDVFSFESPLKDLLDSGEFTLEQLMQEDELLQEVKSMTPQLITFLSQRETISKLLHYIVDRQPIHADKFSYTEIQSNNKRNNRVRRSTDDLTKEESRLVRNDPELPAGFDPRQNSTAEGEFNGGVLDSERHDAVKDSHRTDSDSECILNESSRPGSMDFREVKPADAAKTTMLSGTFPADQSRALKKSKRSDDHDSIIINDNDEGDVELLTVRYPYMACEILCMENSTIIDAFLDKSFRASSQNHSFSPLDKLFSVLDICSCELDDRRAGYFEKILSVLLRIRAATIVGYINERGMELFRKFVKHLGNNSIMQIVQRLMVPPTPTHSNQAFGGTRHIEDDADDEDLELIRCKWGTDQECISLLLTHLTSTTKDCTLSGEEICKATDMHQHDMTTHLSELLTSLTQQAQAKSVALNFLTSSKTMSQIVRSASRLKDGELFYPYETPLTNSLALLEAILLQAGGYGNLIESMSSTGNQLDEVDAPNMKERLGSTSDFILHLPQALESWCQLLSDNDKKSDTQWVINSNRNCVTRLGDNRHHLMFGVSRLRIARVLEALVLMNHSEIDRALLQSHALKNCLDLFFRYKWCNMLHQSVANWVVHVIESGESRSQMQRHLVQELHLLHRLCDSFESDEFKFGNTNAKFRGGNMGHVVIICQAIVHACNALPDEGKEENACGKNVLEADSQTRAYESPLTAETKLTTHRCALSDAIAEIPVEMQKRWSDFVSSQLADITATQSANLGGYHPSLENGVSDYQYGLNFSTEDETLEVSEGDLDVAVSMIEAMKVSHDFDENDAEDVNSSYHPCSKYISSAFEESRGTYRYDDPLGRAPDLDGSLADRHCDTDDLENSDEDDGDNPSNNDSDVPVLDLFAGNFSDSINIEFQANFADFPASQPLSVDPNDFASFDKSSMFTTTFQCEAEPDSRQNLATFNSSFVENDNTFLDYANRDPPSSHAEAFVINSEGACVKVDDPFVDAKINIDEIL